MKNNKEYFLKKGGDDYFYSKKIKYNKFSHKKGHFVRKMDYSKLFSWCPNYKILSIKKQKYEKKDYTAVISLKKCS